MSCVKLSVCFVVFCAVTGCSGQPDDAPDKFLVTGKVTLNGVPVASGEVIVRAIDGSTSSAGEIKGGNYALEATTGNKRVEITAYHEVEGQFNEENPGEKVPVREQYIPGKYNAESELTLTVEKSKVEQNFELTE